MNIQKTLLGTLGGAVTFMLVGFLIWGLALASFHEAHKTQIEGIVNPEPSFVMIFVAMLIAGLLFTVIYQRWAGIKTFKTGAIAGAFIAVMIGLMSELMLLTEYNGLIDSSIVIANALCNIIWGGLGGGVIGWILGRGE